MIATATLRGLGCATSSLALACIASTSACSRAAAGGAIELRVRANGVSAVDANALVRAVDALRIRLEPEASRHLVDVRVDGANEIVVELDYEPGTERIDELRAVIERIHTLEVVVLADDVSAGANLESEFALLESWWSAHPNAPIDRFNALSRDSGGPAAKLRWCVMFAGGYSKPKPAVSRSRPCLVELDPTKAARWTFTAGDAEHAAAVLDAWKQPAIELVWKPERNAEFIAFAAAHRGQRLGFVVDGEMVSELAANDVATKRWLISHTFEVGERDEFLRALRSAIAAGPTPLGLRVESSHKLR